MRKLITIIALLFSVFIVSCKDESKKQAITNRNQSLDPSVDITKIETDYMKWWTYHSNNISLSSNFVGLNENSETISTKQFLETLTSGKFIPLKLRTTDFGNQYKLYKLSDLADENIISTIKSTSSMSLKLYMMEGTSFPSFEFTDLNGNQFTNETTKGKITVFKTWFINCVACVAEFPELNEFVGDYKDIVFISLANDAKSKLEVFLKKKKFEYAVIPSQQSFIVDKLKLQIYPTHIVVDENGIILKVVNKASEMIDFLENTKKATNNIPPPPGV